MALTPITSPIFDEQEEGGRGDAYESGAQLYSAVVTHTNTVAGTGTATLLRLPAGKIRLLTNLSHIVTTGTGVVTANLNLGYLGYTGSDGVAVVADPNAFVSLADIGGGNFDSTLHDMTGGGLPAVGYIEFDSQAGVELDMTIDTANLAADSVITLNYVWMKA